MKLNYKYSYMLIAFIFIINMSFGQKVVESPYQKQFKNGLLAFKKNDWRSARKYFLEALNTCSSKDSIDLIKANIVNTNVAEGTSKLVSDALLIGRDRIGHANMENLLKFPANNKIEKKKLTRYWKNKINQAIRKKAYNSAENCGNQLAMIDSNYAKKNQRIWQKSIQKSKEKYSNQLLRYFDLHSIDSISTKHRLEDTLGLLNLQYSNKELSDTLKSKNISLHFGIMTGYTYSKPQFSTGNESFDRVYPQTTSFTGFKLTLGKVTSRFSFSTEYRFSEYKFNTYTNNNLQNKKIILEYFYIQTTDIPIYVNYQVRPSLYGKDLLLFSLGGIIHQAKAFKYHNYLDYKELYNVTNLNNSWYSMMVGLAFQKKLYKNLKIEFFVKYNYGLNGFLNLESLNALYKPSVYTNNVPNDKPITSSKLNSVSAGIALQLF